MKKIIALIIVSALCQLTLLAQPSQKKTPIKEDAYKIFEISQHDFVYNNNPYILYIAKPRAACPASGYPQLYMLDGNGQFPMAVNGIDSLSAATPLIAAIGYPSDRAFPKERTRDYTIPIANAPDNGGGAENFYQFVATSVKPFVAEHYTVDASKQTLFGHSYGGLFVLYTLFNHPEAFDRYVAASPAIWWGKGAVVPSDRSFLQGKNKNVTITLGEYEEHPERDPSRKDMSAEVRDMKSRRRGGLSARQLSELLKAESIESRFIQYPGKGHGSSSPDAIREAIDVAGK